MRLLLILPALIFFICHKQSNDRVLNGTAVTGCDGITVIKAFQPKLSDTVRIDIAMRPEMRNSIYVLWSSVDSDHNKRIHRSRVNKGAASSTIIEVSPGSRIIDIYITGYEQLGSYL